MSDAPEQVLTYHYTVRDASGAVRDATRPDAPRMTLLGRGDELAAVAARLQDAAPGARLAFTLEPEEAFGVPDPAQIYAIARADWQAAAPVLGPVALQVRTEGGEVVSLSGRIVEVDAERVVFDANHPLAGQRVGFEIEVVAAREATPEEVRAGQPLPFPLDLFARRAFPGEVGDLMRQFATVSMCPPFPWGHWQMARLVRERCAALQGDVIELGVGLGGMSMLLGSLFRDSGRRVFALDTYAGLPPPDPERDNPYFLEGLYRGTDPLLDRLRGALARHDLDEVVTPLPGLFADTLQALPPDARFCLAHLDSDLYRSVRDSLEGVWDRVVPGGAVVIDDFFHHGQGPARACADFFNARGLRPVHHVLFPYAVCVIKGEEAPSRWWRSLDGNAYSFAWMRKDALLREAVEASVARCAPSTRAHANAARLLALLSAPADRNADLYDYQAALEDFWDGIAAGFSAVVPL